MRLREECKTEDKARLWGKAVGKKGKYKERIKHSEVLG